MSEYNEYVEAGAHLSEQLGDLPPEALDCAWAITYAPPQLDVADPAAFVNGVLATFQRSVIDSRDPEAVGRILELARELNRDRSRAEEIFHGWQHDLLALRERYDGDDVGVQLPDGQTLDEWLHNVACATFERWDRQAAATLGLDAEFDVEPTVEAPAMVM